jgi:hypothetical protein
MPPVPIPIRRSTGPPSSSYMSNLQLVKSALLLASLRQLVRPADLPPLPPIRSLAYFQPVIEELLVHPMPDNYPEYLRLKLNRIARNATP